MYTCWIVTNIQPTHLSHVYMLNCYKYSTNTFSHVYMLNCYKYSTNTLVTCIHVELLQIFNQTHLSHVYMLNCYKYSTNTFVTCIHVELLQIFNQQIFTCIHVELLQIFNQHTYHMYTCWIVTNIQPTHLSHVYMLNCYKYSTNTLVTCIHVESFSPCHKTQTFWRASATCLAVRSCKDKNYGLLQITISFQILIQAVPMASKSIYAKFSPLFWPIPLKSSCDVNHLSKIIKWIKVQVWL